MLIRLVGLIFLRFVWIVLSIFGVIVCVVVRVVVFE